MMKIELSQEQMNYCMECGVCTGSCPVSRHFPRFSPRQMIKRSLMGLEDTIVHGRELWMCLTCARCSMRCPAAIDFPEIVRSYRLHARTQSVEPVYSHHGIMQILGRLQTRNLHQQRTQWAEEAGKFQRQGEYFLFVGCAPFFDAAIKYGDTALRMATAVLQFLNQIGIEPVISDDERCCGHDAFWSGDEKTFRRLVEINMEVIRASGAKTVLFFCPEGYHLYREQIPRLFGTLPFEVLHVSELFSQHLLRGDLRLRVIPETYEAGVTYQDPCSLGRKSGIYEAPRRLLSAVPGITFREMPRSKENALCCGTVAWMECSSISKSIQTERLEEARRSGAKILVTACPKCQIHLNCAKSNTSLDIDIVDLYTFIAKHVDLS